MKQFKSFSHVAKLLRLGLKEPVAEETVPASAIVGAPETPRPKFMPTKHYDPLSPWRGIDCDGQFQTYVTRDNEDIPVLVEIKSLRSPDGIDRRWAGEPLDEGEVIFGSCFTLQGEYLDLSPEELERIEREFRS